MKKTSILFISLCLLLCLVPSVGMLFFPTTETTENRAMAEAPRLITEEGALNRSFFEDFERYFNDHMALRNPLVYADATIQSALFQESNISGVIRGTDGWLYYASTLEDYQGKNILSERNLYNLAHNFGVVQEALAARNIDFALTVAPNKNTLYGEHMPYYSRTVIDPDHSAVLLAPYLKEQSVTYLDLFQLFRGQDEVLYLRTDSHWNNKGACLVYNGIMDTLALPHEDHADRDPVPVENRNGDLNKMLYSFYGKGETDYDYGLAQTYRYTTGDDVEDRLIVTENPAGSGTLLMFRDSFANTLIPFLSNEFATACYSKGEPNLLGRFVDTYAPDCVVIEKVERNIADYLRKPPVITAPQAALPDQLTVADTATTVQVETCDADMGYCQIRGTVDPARLQTDSEILVSVDGTVYRAYQTEENGYCLYLDKALFTADSAELRVYVVNGAKCLQALVKTVTLPQ